MAPGQVSPKTPALNAPTTAPAPPPAPPPVHEVSGWRRALLWPAGLLLRLWGRSLRFDVTPEDFARWTKHDEPVAIVLWHNRLFLAAEIVRDRKSVV